MQIISLQAENIKKLTAVSISPDGNLVQITGKNGQGKTSVLDAIWWALGGMTNVQATPIRKGEEKAFIKLDLGKIVVTRRFNAREDGTFTTSITVENDEGARFSTPQKMLDDLLGELTFDPLAFTRMKPADQALALRSLVPDFDFDAADAANKKDFQDRTGYNADAKRARANADAIELPDVIPEKVSASELMAQWTEAVEENRVIEVRKGKRAIYTEARDVMADQIKAMQAELAAKDDEIASWQPLPDPVDADAIKAKLDQAEATNAIAVQAEMKADAEKNFKIAEIRADELTKSIEARKAAAQSAIASADMPIDGLSIDDGIIKLDGVPFEQASDAQQLQCSIGIAMALNPNLKVIRVRDGSLLDGDAMKVLEAMANDKDYQIWIERVDASGKVGFVLEDGHIKGQEVETTEAQQEVISDPKPAPNVGQSLFENDQKA